MLKIIFFLFTGFFACYAAKTEGKAEVKVAQGALPSEHRLKGLDDLCKKEWSSGRVVKKKQNRPLWKGDLLAPQNSGNGSPRFPSSRYPDYMPKASDGKSFEFLEKIGPDPMKQALMNKMGSYQK